MTTAVLPRPTPARRPQRPVDVWNLDRTRCAVGVSLDLPGATVWRARLRPLAGRLTDSSFAANVWVRPLLTSLPLSRVLFLRGTPRTTRLWLTADGDLLGAQPIVLTGEVSAGSRSWPAEFAVRHVPLEEGRVLVTIAGRIVRPETTFPGAHLRFEAVGEFTRCD